MKGKLLMIGTDRLIFNRLSNVAVRQIEYAKDWQEVHIIVFTLNKFKEINLGDNVWVYPTNSLNKLLYVFDSIRLGSFIIKGRGITNITCQDPSLTASAGLHLKKLFNLPVEIQVHGDISSSYYTKSIKNRLLKIISLSNLPKADHIRVVSQKLKNYFVDILGLSDSKIEVRPIKVDVEYIKNSQIKPECDLRIKYKKFSHLILMASRIEKEKNIELAILAFERVVKNNDKIALIIAGEGGRLNSIKSLTDKLGLSQNIFFEPWADRDTLISYYKTCDIFLNTSFYEGYGMTLVEAQAAGCKVISTDVGVAKEIGAIICKYDDADISRLILENCL